MKICCYMLHYVAWKSGSFIRLQVGHHTVPSSPPVFSWLHYPSYHALCAGEAEQLSFVSGRRISTTATSDMFLSPIQDR